MKKTFFLATFAPSFLFAQSFTGSISGTVKDSTGAVITKAAVLILNIDNNARTDVRTDESGAYSAPLLPPGRYTIEASAEGSE